MRRGWVRTALILAVALAPLACHQATAAVDCPPPPTTGCPEAGAPSFSDVYMNVINPLCDRCHIAGGQEAVMPLTSYQQVFGQGGVEVSEIRNQIESCLMPPPGGPEVLTDADRQLLLAWISCGAHNDSPATDGSAGD